MQIILLDRISNLGNLGDQIKVKAGYARNFLIPYGKAVQANKKNIEYFNAYRTELEIKFNEILTTAKARVKKINEIGSITIESKAGYEGKLFGSIGARDISKAITAAGIEVNRKEIRLPNGVLRTVGEHEILLQLHSEVSTKLVVKIISG